MKSTGCFFVVIVGTPIWNYYYILKVQYRIKIQNYNENDPRENKSTESSLDNNHYEDFQRILNHHKRKSVRTLEKLNNN